jgi:NitT/TauT family transport system substrate-binding protein
MVKKLLGTMMGVSLALGGLSACGEQEDTSSDGLTKVVLRLNFIADGSAAPFYLAKEEGLYERAGLDVSIEAGKGSLLTAQTVAAGKDTFGYITADSAIRAASAGGDIKLVGSIQRSIPMNVIYHPGTTISTLDDLVGLDLVTSAQVPQGPILAGLARSEGMDPSAFKFVNMDPSAEVAYYQNHPNAAVLSRPGYEEAAFEAVDEAQYIQYRDLGADLYGNSIVTSGAFADEDPDTVEAFVQASVEGWSMAVEDPNAAAVAMNALLPSAGDVEELTAECEGALSNIPGMGNDEMALTPFDIDNLEKEIDFLHEYVEMENPKGAETYVDLDFQKE